MHKPSKSAQISSQTLIYILVLIVIAMVFLFGYQSIKTRNKKQNQVILIQFQNQLKNDVVSLSGDFGSIKIKEYKLPSGYEEICFVDLKNLKSLEDDTDFTLENVIINHPIILDTVKSNTQKNVFLFGPEGFKTFYVNELQIADVPYYSCIKSNIKSIDLEIEGKGDGSVVKTPPNEVFVNL